MASPKEKLLDSAQKSILKGQFDRAIKDYEQIVALEPKEPRHRQKLAELYARVNRTKDALREYETIARSYDSGGFYLKAIAVYKQIQKLEPSNINIALTLATLNEKQGLTGNALAEYKTVVDYHESRGNPKEAAGILERMLALDQENLNIQLKLAETYFAGGLKDQAYSEFTKAISALKNRGDEAAFDRVCKKMQGLFPDRDFILDVLKAEINSGAAAAALPRLKQFLAKNEGSRQGLNLLVEACRQLGDRAGERNAFQRILQKYPEDAEAKSGLVESALAERNADEALKLLGLYGKDLLKTISPHGVEGYYKRLQEFDPYNQKILEGLKRVYEAIGDQAKLADINTRLSIAGPSFTAPVPAESAPDFSVTDDAIEPGEIIEDVEEVPAEPAYSPVVAAVPIMSAPPADDEWQDEIEISLPGEEEISLDLPDDGASFDNAVPEFSLELPSDVAAFDAPSEELSLDLPNELPAFDDPVAEMPIPAYEASEEVTEPSGYELNAEMLLAEAEDVDDIHMEPVEEDEGVVNIDDLALPDTGHLFELSEDLAVLADSAEKKLSKYSSSGVLSAFKKSVDQVLDKEDFDTHYNLGIAYKEMGLFDDAISEFKIAALDPTRKLDCLTLKAICYRDKGDAGKAEEIIKKAQSMDGLSAETKLALTYELGQLYEMTGRMDDAIKIFENVHQSDAGFRDVAAKIARYRGEEDALNLLRSDVDIELEEVE